MVSVSGRFPSLASEDAIADERVEQHQRKYDNAAPEHERETGLWRGGLVDGDNGGVLYGQNDSANVPNADRRARATI
jgi:hypothetical protein